MRSATSTAPGESSTVAELRAYAEARGIDVPSRARKSEILEIIREA